MHVYILLSIKRRKNHILYILIVLWQKCHVSYPAIEPMLMTWPFFLSIIPGVKSLVMTISAVTLTAIIFSMSATTFSVACYHASSEWQHGTSAQMTYSVATIPELRH